NTRLHHIPDFQANWGQDIALLAIFIVHQGNPGRPIGIVFKRGNGPWNSGLVAPEINFSIKPFMPPPRKRTVVRPSLFLAPVLRRNDMRDFSGLFFDSSSVVTAVIPRRPGVLGLYALIPIRQSS